MPKMPRYWRMPKMPRYWRMPKMPKVPKMPKARPGATLLCMLVQPICHPVLNF
jgi:hypothetical protein